MKIKLRSIKKAAVLLSSIIFVVLVFAIFQGNGVPFFKAFIYALMGVLLGVGIIFLDIKMNTERIDGFFFAVADFWIAVYFLIRLIF